MRKQSGPEVFRITGARAGLTEDVRARQRRYVISMSIRTVSVILAVVLWNIEQPLAWVMLVLGAVLPYVAVVFANGGRENGSTEMPTITIPPSGRPALEATSVEQSSERDGRHPHPADGAPAADDDAQPTRSTPAADDTAADGDDTVADTDSEHGDDTSATDGDRTADNARANGAAHATGGAHPADDGRTAESAHPASTAGARSAQGPAFGAAGRPAAQAEPVTDRSDA